MTVRYETEQQKAKYDWEFLFLGANNDAVEIASTSKCILKPG